jgi:hypothetical protein
MACYMFLIITLWFFFCDEVGLNIVAQVIFLPQSPKLLELLA